MGDDQDDDSNLSVAARMLAEIGDQKFLVQPFRVDSSRYGLPQGRKRVYIVGLERLGQRFPDPELAMDAICNCLKLVHREFTTRSNFCILYFL